MRVVFIVQGEGRGHLTQAISLASMLRTHGHEVLEVLVGKSRSREIPDFFRTKIAAPVRVYEAPSFVFKKDKKHIDKLKTFLFNTNIYKLSKYGKSIEMIYRRLKFHKPDMVVNFYEMLPGFLHLRFNEKIPFVNIGHQYLLRHPDFKFGKIESQSMMVLKLHTLLSSIGATKIMALSFYPMKQCAKEKMTVVPPLLRPEVLKLKPYDGGYILGYMLNHGYESEVRKWHEAHPEVTLHFFWDKKGAPRDLVVDETFTLHALDDGMFLKYMEGCSGYVTTAGFESVCEALFLDKPVMLIPAHVEQDINAADAVSINGGIVSETFDLSRLLEYMKKPRQLDHDAFKKWVMSAEELFIKELASVVE